MKRIIVIGCPGSGKTTFAKRLAELAKLPIYHLDAIWHKPDKTHIPREEFDGRIREIFNEESWIIDGNYRRTIEMRVEAADTVFLFDLPKEVCLEGALARIGVVRADMPWREEELDPAFRQQIESFAENTLPEIYEILGRYENEKKIIIFKSRDEADDFLKNIIN
jgi:adenylate kinase family enzyme